MSRATISRALVAMEVVGMVSVRHGDGVVLIEPEGSTKVTRALRRHARQLPEIIEARDALETKLAALAAGRRTESDLTAIDEALAFMEREVAAGGRGVERDERFDGAVTAAGHSRLLAKLMAEISDLIRDTRISSLSQPGRPANSLKGHRKIAEAIRAAAAPRYGGEDTPARRALHDGDVFEPIDPGGFADSLRSAGFVTAVVDSNGDRFRFRAQSPVPQSVAGTGSAGS